MAQYSMLVEDEPFETIEAKDAETARKLAARKLSYEGVAEGTLVGPSGQEWIMEYPGFLEGLSGWVYSTDEGDAPKRVFTSFNRPANALSKGDWYGIYEIDGGMLMRADDSYDFNDEDFSVLGAVYYAIYDDEGEVDGGWMGYDEESSWNDFVEFVESANRKKVGRCVIRASDDSYDEAVDMLEEGTPIEEVYSEFGIRPASASLRGKAKKKPAKKTAPKSASKRKAPAKRPQNRKGVRR